jgi:hypothetical protein
VLAKNGEGPTHCGDSDGRAQKLVCETTGDRHASKPAPEKTQVSAGSLAIHGHAPILVLCAPLLAAGLNPDAAIQVYSRGRASSPLGAALDAIADGGGAS